MDQTLSLAYSVDAKYILSHLGITPDPWQKTLLLSDKNLLVNVHRQGGKSTVIGAKACAIACLTEKSTVLILSCSQRQSAECFRRFLDAYHALRPAARFKRVSRFQGELDNGSRVIALPGREDTIRGFANVNLLIVDEAARVDDEVYRAVRPMVAVANGKIALLSTPFGQRGFFYKEWIGQGDWDRLICPATECRRLSAAFLRDERRAMGETYFAQEYLNSFTAVVGLVFPNFDRCRINAWPNPEGRKIGGIDWGWRNPFAAIWGIYDPRTDVYYVQAERYLRNEPLHKHRDALRPLDVAWSADPAGATELVEFRAADVKVWRGNNDLKAGIAAVNARIETDRLKVYWPGCPNLVEESQLYRYPDRREMFPDTEKPIDDHNHALSALRYAISRIDARFMARFRRSPFEAHAPHPPPDLPRMDINDPALWTGCE